VSVVSALEISAEAARGRLELPDVANRYVPRVIERHGFTTLSVHLAHALRAGSLPDVHRDPFDRLLIAQAQVEGIPIITADPAIGRYEVETIW
jgi:PIN domain nuclease of toxin-antitoxin system